MRLFSDATRVRFAGISDTAVKLLVGVNEFGAGDSLVSISCPQSLSLLIVFSANR